MPVVLEFILERVTNISMGTDLAQCQRVRGDLVPRPLAAAGPGLGLGAAGRRERAAPAALTLSAWCAVEGAARQLLEMVDQPVGAGGGGIGIAGDDRREGRGVDLGVLREAAGILDEGVPEPAGQTVDHADAAGEDRIVRGARLRPRGSSGSHAGSGPPSVAAAAARISLASRCISARSRSRARTAASRTTRVSSGRRTSKQLQLLDHVDRGHQHAAARVDLDEALELQPLQRLADRRPATAELLAELVLGDHRARPQLAGDDHLLERAIGGLGQGFSRCLGRPAVQL